MLEVRVRQATTKSQRNLSSTTSERRTLMTDGEDIATALERLQDIDVKDWKPRIETSVELDDQIRITEQKQFDVEYKMEYDDFMKRKKSYKNNKTRAYGLIFERCTRAMAQKIQARKILMIQ